MKKYNIILLIRYFHKQQYENRQGKARVSFWWNFTRRNLLKKAKVFDKSYQFSKITKTELLSSVKIET